MNNIATWNSFPNWAGFKGKQWIMVNVVKVESVPKLKFWIINSVYVRLKAFYSDFSNAFMTMLYSFRPS